MMIYLQLFWEYLKIGLFSVGGGMTSLPFLFDLTTKYDWFTKEELADMIAVAECTPGPMAINTATYVGYTTAGVGGSVIATVAAVIPSLTISLLVCLLLHRFALKTWLDRAFWGLRPVVAGLIAFISYDLIELSLAADMAAGFASGISWLHTGLFMLLSIAIFLFKGHPIIYIAIGAVMGIILKL